MTKEYITFLDNGKGRVLSVGTVKVSECDSSACFSCQVFGLQSSLCFPASYEGFEILFKMGCSRVLDSQGDIVCMIVLEGQIFRADFS
jgi:hypothetical protein